MPLSDSGESLPAEEIAGIIDGLFSNEESTFQGFSAPPVGRSFGGQPLLGAQSDLFGGQSFSNNRQSSGNLPSLKDAKRANDIRNQFSGGNQFGGGFGAASAGPSAGGASASGFTGAGSGNSASGLGGGFPGEGGGGGFGGNGGPIAAGVLASAIGQGFLDRQPEGSFGSRLGPAILPSPGKNLGLTDGSEFNAKEFGIGTFAPFLNFFREPNTPGQEDGSVLLQDLGMSDGKSGNNRNSSGGGGSFIGDLIGGLFG